jgi:hypothetical protein
MSYVYDNHVFHYIVENRITYLCMCDETEKRRIPFAFLVDMKQLFNEQYGEQAHTGNVGLYIYIYEYVYVEVCI